METVALPILHVTNYQQYIDASYMHQIVMDNLPQDTHWPEAINISIAYMQIVKKAGAFITTLALSILGKTYKVKTTHANADFYLAQYGLDLNTYANQGTKDNHIRLFQQAFQGVVYNKKTQIIKALKCAYGNQH